MYLLQSEISLSPAHPKRRPPPQPPPQLPSPQPPLHLHYYPLYCISNLKYSDELILHIKGSVQEADGCQGHGEAIPRKTPLPFRITHTLYCVWHVGMRIWSTKLYRICFHDSRSLQAGDTTGHLSTTLQKRKFCMGCSSPTQ